MSQDTMHKTGSLSGMTGFARVTGEVPGLNWIWEAKSVNGKSLDLRLRIPPDFSFLEIPARQALAQNFHRGNIQISLSVQRTGPEKHYHINRELLNQLRALSPGKDETILLTVPGVVEAIESVMDPAETKTLTASMMASFDNIIRDLKASRRGEGTALKPILASAIADIATQTDAARAIAEDQGGEFHARLKEKLSVLLSDNTLSEDRLAQEAALLAIKTDVSEEIDRLDAHCEQARVLLEKDSPVGRKLDFLAQEFNREVNTLCSKSASIDLTQIGLDLKSLIEQFREQAANVE